MDKKKLSAAMAAVFTYIKTSEEAACASGIARPVQEPFLQPVPVVQQSNIWGITGRQTHMQANSMMQLRLFK